jgi:hypothetical protein
VRYLPKIVCIVVAVMCLASIYLHRDRDGEGDGRSTTRAAWADQVAPICERYERIAAGHAPPPGATAVEIGTRTDAMLEDMRPFVAELQRVDRPAGDEQVARWVALQAEGHEVIGDYAAALRSGDRERASDAVLRLVEYTGRDRQAAVGLGLPDSCVSDAPAGAAPAP